MPCDLFASEVQYLDHLLPVWRALPEDERGRVYLAGRLSSAARDEGLVDVRIGYPPPAEHPILVASFQDCRSAAHARRATVYVEHGAGQTYDSGDVEHRGHPSYSGSGEHDGVVLFVCPNETVAERWRAVYPSTPAVAVGCPKLDPYAERPPARRDDTVAVSFHAEIRWVPETTSAWNHYLPGLRDVIARLNAEGVTVLGHAHPRLFDRVAGAWETMGAVPTRDFADVLRLASVYAIDNSCVVPETPVLCADLRWRPAGILRAGDRIVACDEENYRENRHPQGFAVKREDRRLRTAVVTANQGRMLECAEIETTHGRMSVSVQHPWLVRRRLGAIHSSGKKAFHQTWTWVPTADLKVGDVVAHFAHPWRDDETRDGGWFAGLLDGEGCLHVSPPSKLGSRRAALSVSQVDGLVLDEAKRVMTDRGLVVTDQRVVQATDCHKLTIGGGLAAKMRLLGELRPVRLLAKAVAREIWDGCNVSAQVEGAEITAIRSLGVRQVATISTSSATFIAGGFIGHNSTLYEAAAVGIPVVAMNAPWYRRDVHHGLRFWNLIPGETVDEPDELADAILAAAWDPPEAADRRHRVTAEVYAGVDGKASLRAAEAVLTLT